MQVRTLDLYYVKICKRVSAQAVLKCFLMVGQDLSWLWSALLCQKSNTVYHDFCQGVYVNILHARHRYLKTYLFASLTWNLTLSTEESQGYLLLVSMVLRWKSMFSISKHFHKRWWFHNRTKEHFFAVQTWCDSSMWWWAFSIK